MTHAARHLKAEELCRRCDPATLGFTATDELAPLTTMIGQDRALAATMFGIGMKHEDYNLFVLGPAATGKTTTMERLLAAAAAEQPRGSDYCYVVNFADPYRPTALELPAGRGRELASAMTRFVEECRTRLPRAFESEEFERQRARIGESVVERQHGLVEELEGVAREHGFAVVRTPGGLAISPAPLGKPLSPEEFHALPDEMKQKISAGGSAVEERLEATLRKGRQIERESREAHDKLVSEVTAAATRELIRELRERFAGLDTVQRYLDGVEADVTAHAERFHAPEEGGHVPLPFVPSPTAFLDRYRVNVIVDRTGARGAPVVRELNPTNGNLIGRIEHHAQFGALVTDFSMIKGGALHRANGGYLILEAKEVLRSFLAWDALKKALKSRSIRIEEPLEEFRVASAATLAPEPILLSAKVVLIGTPALYYLLYALDEDFRELFKVKVDFDDSFVRSADSERLFARFVGNVCLEESLPAFAAEAVARLIEHAARCVSHQGRLSARLGILRDVVREAAVSARGAGRARVEAPDVERAIAAGIRRANLVEERVARAFAEGDLLLATDGEAVGQVNGISVMSAGDYAFGRPSRITVRTHMGAAGVVDIEREAKLGGPIHSKGVLILTGYLAGLFGQRQPLALSASIAFEQHYEEIDGDSASSAELYALLSSLGGIPLRQAIAVTGSVNQQGEIQPVGAINEKIEGFFDLCRARGLTGTQGVLIPESNVGHLMLRADVVEAVRHEKFHVYAVARVAEGLELLAGRPAGERGADGAFPSDSVNAAVERALAERLAAMKELGGGGAFSLPGRPRE